MIIFYSIFILFVLILIYTYINQIDNNSNNIDITEAHIYRVETEKYETLHTDLNITNKIHVGKYLMLYKIKILFKYEINFETYEGYFYIPQNKYYTHQQMLEIKKYLSKYKNLLIFYNIKNPKKYWL